MLAQSVEQLAFNQLVTSSSLVQPTTGLYYQKFILHMKKFICAATLCASLAYATDSASLINVQNNYQSAKSDYNNKQDMVNTSTNDVTTAKNNLDNAHKNLLQAQKDLKDAETDLKQKNAALVKAKQDFVVSNQNLKTAGDAVNQAWKK